MEHPDSIEQRITSLLEKELYASLQPLGNQEKTVFQWLSGDGSSRKFVRVLRRNESVCIAVLPPSSSKKDMAEFRSALEIGRHLHKVGGAVPEIRAVDEGIGLILFEDFGDTRLHDMLASDRQQTLELYRQVVKELVDLQVRGRRGFDQNWCYDTSAYDREVMLGRESGYFFKAFWQDTLQAGAVEGLDEEFEDIAAQVMSSSEPFFLHRDFQSRNIMVSNDRIGVIDFQAGRLGPPGYDLASLLIDPYAALSESEQQDLFSIYIQEMSAYPEVSRDKIIRSFPFLALQRNLQIIGAFAYLSGALQKPFFRPYIVPSLSMLRKRLQEKEFQHYPVLQQTVATAISAYNRLG